MDQDEQEPEKKVKDLFREGLLPLFERLSKLRDRLEVRRFRRPSGCSARLYAKFPIDDPFELPDEDKYSSHRPVYVHGRFVRMKEAVKVKSEVDKFRAKADKPRPKPLRLAEGQTPGRKAMGATHTPSGGRAAQAPAPAAAAAAAKSAPPEGLPDKYKAKWGSMYEGKGDAKKAPEKQEPVIPQSNVPVRAQRPIRQAGGRSKSGRMVTGRSSGRQGGGSAPAAPKTRAEMDARTAEALARQRQNSVPVRSGRQKQMVHDPAAQRAAESAQRALQARQDQEAQRSETLRLQQKRTEDRQREQAEILAAQVAADRADETAREAREASEALASTVEAPTVAEVEEPAGPEAELAALEARPFESLSNAEKTKLMVLRRGGSNTGFKPSQRPRYYPGSDGAGLVIPEEETAEAPAREVNRKRSSGGLDDLFGGGGAGRAKMGRKTRKVELVKDVEASEPVKEPEEPVQAAPVEAEPVSELAALEARPFDSLSNAEKTQLMVLRRGGSTTGFKPSQRPRYRPGSDGAGLDIPEEEVDESAPKREVNRRRSSGGLDDLFGGSGGGRAKMGRKTRKVDLLTEPEPEPVVEPSKPDSEPEPEPEQAAAPVAVPASTKASEADTPEEVDEPWIPEAMRGKKLDERTRSALKKMWKGSTGFRPSQRPRYRPGADGAALEVPEDAPDTDKPIDRSPRRSGGGMDGLFGGGQTRVRVGRPKKKE